MIEIDGNTEIGNNAKITATNIGINSNNGSEKAIGHCDGELFTPPLFIAGDNLTLTASNTGIDTSSTSFNNFIGANKGIGTVGSDQVFFYSVATIGNNATITVTNSGESSSTGENNSVGYVNGTQLSFGEGCEIGNNATITITNTGESSTENLVGFVNDYQMYVGGPFIAGTNLVVKVTNTSTSSEQIQGVGESNRAQIQFDESCQLSDGTLLYAANNGSGIILGSQIVFGEGFTIDGKGTIQVVNEGMVGKEKTYSLEATRRPEPGAMSTSS